jgi:hypothetical protein
MDRLVKGKLANITEGKQMGLLFRGGGGVWLLSLSISLNTVAKSFKEV